MQRACGELQFNRCLFVVGVRLGSSCASQVRGMHLPKFALKNVESRLKHSLRRGSRRIKRWCWRKETASEGEINAGAISLHKVGLRRFRSEGSLQLAAGEKTLRGNERL